ncbi:MAG: response regulator transcription factor [Lachnospiraceae bacterium]|nr:response regulator transcription factor [Lachnospiraceae bacterium]
MYKILIADDEAMIRQGIKCLFNWEELGYTIIDEAASGDAAYQKIMELLPDVVLIDIRMPGMLGLDVIRKAREEGFAGKVIILSGYSDFKYAQEAIRYGVQYYLTKPIDEDELEEILHTIRTELDAAISAVSTAKHYREKAHDSIVQDILLGKADLSRMNLAELHMESDIYQVVIYEKYSHNIADASYRFSDLLRVTNQDNHSFDTIMIDNQEVILLKGRFAIQQFNDFLERYEREKRPQKDSPLDSLFITYGRCVHSLKDVPLSYEEASKLLHRRFFCEQGQHTIGYDALPDFEKNTPIINDTMRNDYAARLLNYIQAFNRNKTGETLKELQDTLYNASDSIDAIKLFLADLYLQIKEQINHLYNTVEIPFAGNAEIIRGIEDKRYLYEIILFFSAQFEIIMSSIGNSSRDSVLDDILHYINHNYSSNITLENIAPLFGYNSSYLGKIFSKKMGENFNSYVDHIRIERSKEMLMKEDLKVYSIAEKVGYRNVDYFHIKFKKYVGQSPAEFRKKYKGNE